MGFVIERVLADSLYGEGGRFVEVLHQLKLPYIVAIRSNHGALMPNGQRVCYNRWQPYDQPLAKHPTQRRYIREIILDTRRAVRYDPITKGSTDEPDKTYIAVATFARTGTFLWARGARSQKCPKCNGYGYSWLIMSNLSGNILLSVGTQYSCQFA